IMRRVVVGCLSLALFVAVARAPAQEVRWRSASPPNAPDAGSGFASDRVAPGADPAASGPVALKRPQPLGAAAEVTPVTFQAGSNPKSQTEQLPQPMPVGPGGPTPEKTAAPKALTMPGFDGPADPWGGPIPPWNGGSAFPTWNGGSALPPPGAPVVGDGRYLDGTPFGGDCC